MSTADGWYKPEQHNFNVTNTTQSYSYNSYSHQPSYNIDTVDFTSYDYNSGVQQPQLPSVGSNEFNSSYVAAPYLNTVSGNLYNPAQYNVTSSVQYFNPLDSTSSKFGQPDSGIAGEDELPLLEELGINFNHIVQKTLVVLNPLKSAELDVVQDTDLAGPLVFCLAFGGTLLLAGKLQFGYIYGLGLMGCFAMYCLLNLMSVTAVGVVCIMSILGYCLLPMCLLSSVAVLLSLKGPLGVALTALSVFWCSASASNLFVLALNMTSQRLLVAYPCSLVYCMFALLTVF